LSYAIGGNHHARLVVYALRMVVATPGRGVDSATLRDMRERKLQRYSLVRVQIELFRCVRSLHHPSAWAG
jgi:hypothetical protein